MLLAGVVHVAIGLRVRGPTSPPHVGESPWSWLARCLPRALAPSSAMLCIPKANHKKLVDDCYPPPKAIAGSAPEYRPNSNEMGRLSYYAQSKPAKLLKIGKVIDARAVSEARAFQGAPNDRNKAQLMITLAVLKELVSQSHGLVYLAPTVQSVLSHALQAATVRGSGLRDGDVSARAANTFATYVKALPGGAMETDEGVSRSVYQVLTELARLADPIQGRGGMNERGLLQCLAGMDGMVKSPIIHTSAFPRLLSHILPVLFETISLHHVPLTQTADIASSTMDNSVELSSSDAQSPGPTQTVQAALLVLRQILASSDAMQMRAVMQQTLAWLDTRDERWKDEEWSVWILGVLAQWARPASRYVVPHSLVDTLTDQSTQRQVALRETRILQALHMILVSKTEIVGLNMSEMLDGHVHFMLSHVEQDPYDPTVSAAIDAIGHMATHARYGDQLDDFVQQIMPHIVSVRDGSLPLDVKQNSICALLHSLMAIFRSNNGSFHVPVSAWASTESLLLSTSSVVRATYLQALCVYLHQEQDRIANGQAAHEGNSDSLGFLHSFAAHVVALVSSGMPTSSATVSMPNMPLLRCTPSDFALLHQALDALLIVVPAAAMLAFTPALFVLDQTSGTPLTGQMAQAEQSMTCRWLVATLLARLGSVWQVPSLVEYAHATLLPTLEGIRPATPALPERYEPIQELPVFSPGARATTLPPPRDASWVAEQLSATPTVQSASHVDHATLCTWLLRPWSVASALQDARTAARPTATRLSNMQGTPAVRTTSHLLRGNSMSVSQLRQVLASQTQGHSSIPMSMASGRASNMSSSSRRRARSITSSDSHDVGDVLDRFSVSPSRTGHARHASGQAALMATPSAPSPVLATPTPLSPVTLSSPPRMVSVSAPDTPQVIEVAPPRSTPIMTS